MFATSDAGGWVSSADPQWLAWFPSAEVRHRIDESLVREMHVAGQAGDRAEGLAGSTRLIPVRHDGEVLVIEVVAYALGVGDSFLFAARETRGRVADDLDRRYLATYMDATDVAVIGADPEGTIRYWNAAASRVYGYDESEALGLNITTLAQPSRLSETYEALELSARGEPVERDDTVGRKKSGEPVELSISIRPIRDDHGTVIGSVRLVRDIGQLKESDRRAWMYATSVEFATSGVLLWRQDEGALRLVGANPAAYRICGLAEDAIGKSSDDLVEQLPMLATLRWDPKALEDRPAPVRDKFELPRRERAGAEATWVEIASVRTGPWTMSTTVRDISAEVRAQLERRRLLGLLADVEDAQRKQLAEALHDDTIQVLAAANLELQGLRRDVDVGAIERVKRIEAKVNRATSSLRSVAFELYPPDLESGGIVPALRNLAERTLEPSIEFELHDKLGREVRPMTLRTAYRVLNEALNNVHRHAHASGVSVHLTHDDDDLVITVRDDGVGFDLDGPWDSVGHLGVRTMLDRAGSQDGSLTIHQMSPGTELTLRLPDRADRVTESTGRDGSR